MRTITVTGPIFKLNDLPGMGYREHAKLTRHWRNAVETMLGDRDMRWRAPGPVKIEVRSWNRSRADRSAYVPAAKGMIDGLGDSYKTAYGKRVQTHVGWWPDDGPDWVRSEEHFPPTLDRSLPEGLIRVELTIIEL